MTTSHLMYVYRAQGWAYGRIASLFRLSIEQAYCRIKDFERAAFAKLRKGF